MEQQMNEVLGYLKTLKKRRYLFLAVSFSVITVLIAYSYYIPRKYQADSTVFIESNVINTLTQGLAVSPEMGDQTRVLKFALLSRDTLQKTLQQVSPQLVDETKIQQKIAQLQQNTEITTHGKDLFRVSIIDPNPAFAQTYINTLIKTYVDQNTIGKRNDTAGASKFLDRQLEQFRGKLDQAEDNIIVFRKEQKNAITSDETSLLAAIADYRRQIDETDLAIGAEKSHLEQLQGELKSVAKTVATDEMGGSLKEAQLQTRLQELLLTYTENYPEVVKVRQELEALNVQKNASSDGAQGAAPVTTLHRQLRLKILQSEAEIRTLQTKKASLGKFVQQREEELRYLPENQKQLAALTQERDTYRSIYEKLLLRLNQSEVSREMELGEQATTFRVVDAALFPTEPVSPNMIKLLLVAIAGGLFCGIGAVILKENLDSSIKSVAQLRELGVEVLATVTSIADDELDRRQSRRDRWVFSASGVYFTAILGLFVVEILKVKGIL